MVHLPPLRDMLGCWRSEGMFYFLQKFQNEVSPPTSSQKPGKSIRKTTLLSRMSSSFLIAIRFTLIISKMVLTTKGRTVVFNHTNRSRLSKNHFRPLYLSPKVLLDSLVVFEDSAKKLHYSQPVKMLRIECINQMTELLTGLLSRLFYIKTGIYDREIVGFYVKVAVWKAIFRFIKPRSVRLYVWYGKEAVIVAARSCKIEVADVQHGIMYTSHPFYNLIASKSRSNSAYLLPDFCLVYGEYWRQTLIKSGWEPSQVRVLGYSLDTNASDQDIIEKPYVLYSSQPHTNQIILKHIASILVECQRRGCLIVIALHPMESGEAYAKILTTDVRLGKSDSYDLLRNCLVHVSVSSTLLWESMLFEKSSYILDTGLEETGFLTDLLNYKFGRLLIDGEYPEPFLLPTTPPKEYFFSDKFNQNDYEICTKLDN